MVLLLLIFLGSEMHSEQEQQQPSLWTSALRLVGLEEADSDGESFLKAKVRITMKQSFLDAYIVFSLQDIAGSGSCSPEALDLRRIFRLMGQAVLNQEQALARMERALAGSEQFHSVALLGPPGVGKSLAANALRQNFPWPANAHTYSWNTRVGNEVMKFRLVRQFAEGLSDCGANLLIIDNLATCDHGLVPIYNRLIREREGEPDRNQTVLVVYVFTLETDMYWEQFELLQQQLPAETTIVSFRFFARDDLLDCLANELQVEQRYLSEEKVSLVLAEAMRQVHEMGCKSLRRLIFEHGVPCVRKPR